MSADCPLCFSSSPLSCVIFIWNRCNESGTFRLCSCVLCFVAGNDLGDLREYDPNLLDDPQWPCGKHKRVLIFPSYMVRKVVSLDLTNNCQQQHNSHSLRSRMKGCLWSWHDSLKQIPLCSYIFVKMSFNVSPSVLFLGWYFCHCGPYLYSVFPPHSRRITYQTDFSTSVVYY